MLDLWGEEIILKSLEHARRAEEEVKESVKSLGDDRYYVG